MDAATVVEGAAYSDFRESTMPPSNPLDYDYYSDASRPTAEYGKHLSRLTIDEKRTYQKWKRAALIVYGPVTVIIAVLSIAIGPTDRNSASFALVSAKEHPLADY
jgi:hypothetical protein